MRRIILNRTESSDEGTFGQILLDGAVYHTGELPWRGNRKDVSCIPAGVYQCAWTYSKRFKRMTYQVIHVPNRSAIRFHSANFVGDKSKGFRSQLNGCIAIGRYVAALKGQKGVFDSRVALALFEEALKHEPFELEIINAYDGAAPVA